ncbi:hypothetical protein [Lyngbya sp. CCY1209]|uniref:hypothetical protein n=1 Tax=Lyngbya sp. CCY1209 TaxID=2886103 RepID=UPI002D20CFDB|nr:hypothetical protein [Lyngbya sp. CCY1209]MEB3884019.1 hypothetical protein [Lyngbya sp. CCY1209]
MTEKQTFDFERDTAADVASIGQLIANCDEMLERCDKNLKRLQQLEVKTMHPGLETMEVELFVTVRLKVKDTVEGRHDIERYNSDFYYYYENLSERLEKQLTGNSDLNVEFVSIAEVK